MKQQQQCRLSCNTLLFPSIVCIPRKATSVVIKHVSLVVLFMISVPWLWCDAFQLVYGTSTHIPETSYCNSQRTSTLLQSTTTSETATTAPFSFFPSILPSPHLSIVEKDKIYEMIQQEYEQELDTGYETFGKTNGIHMNNVLEKSTILDETFENNIIHHMIKYNNNNGDDSDQYYNSFKVQGAVGKNSGPDELHFQRNGNTVFQTKYPIISDMECNELIKEAKSILANEKQISSLDLSNQSGTSDTNTTTNITPTNTELGEVRVSQLHHTRLWLRTVLHTRLFPLLASRYGLVSSGDVTLQDGLIIGYGYQSYNYGSKAQPIHRDSCLLSINIALSSLNDYTDGGTYFEGTRIDDTTEKSIGGTIYTERGHATCHPGGISHAGRSVGPNSERWVLVLFCIVKNYPEMARRCHAKGMMYHQNQENELAKSFYQVGLSFKPNDHLLLTSLGRIYMEGSQIAGKEKLNAAATRNCLALAALGYDHCMKAHMALGRIMLSNRKPRAALRRFDTILEWLKDRDIHEPTTTTTTVENKKNRIDTCWEEYRTLGYDARYYGAQAALISAREAKRRIAIQQSSSTSIMTFDWKHHVSIAIERCKILLQSNQDDTRIYGMLQFAENLLNE